MRKITISPVFQEKGEMNYGAVGGEAVATSNDQYYEEVIQRVQIKYYSNKEALINQPCDVIKKGEKKWERKPLKRY